MLIRVHLPHKMVVLFITNYRTFQDGHEICFVGDEAFRELSEVDSNADKLLDEVCYHCHYSRYRIGIYLSHVYLYIGQSLYLFSVCICARTFKPLPLQLGTSFYAHIVQKYSIHVEGRAMHLI